MELFWARVGAPSSSARMHSLGSISDQRLLSLAYSAADLFVIPSREENFPNVILESLCIGTPVIGLPAGGIPEMIEDGVNGVLAGSIDSMGLVDAIRRAGTLQFNREAIRRDTAARYAPSLVARKYLEIYDSLLS